MKKIAIFVGGSGEAAQRIVKLFNDGNRVHTVLLVADDSAAPVLDEVKDDSVHKLHIPDAEWPLKAPELARILRENEVKLLVLDGFYLVLPDELLEAVDGEMLRVTSSELAPKEVVAALEKEYRQMAEEKPVSQEEEGTPTLESEWADSLKIQYHPPKVPQTPPMVPGDQSPETENASEDSSGEPINVEPINIEPSFNNEPQQQDDYFRRENNFNRPQFERRRYEERKEDSDREMPSTWLIWSILVTVFCCFIPGIIAIIFSSQVSSRFYSGDYEGARRASRNAEIWIIISFVLGVLTATLYFPFMLIGG